MGFAGTARVPARVPKGITVQQLPAAVLLSVKPVYVDMILSGEKSVELRRVFPSLEGVLAYLYASTPVRQVLARVTIADVDRDRPEQIWLRHGHLAGLGAEAFGSYFSGAPTASALRLTDVRRMKNPLSLAELRGLDCEPPQSYRYLHPQSPALATLKSLAA